MLVTTVGEKALKMEKENLLYKLIEETVYRIGKP